MKFNINLEGKILEVIKPGEKCFIKIKVNSFLIDLPCPEMCDFRLEDNLLLNCELTINDLKIKDEIKKNFTNKLEVQDEQ
jgi:hypothetical protein